MSTTYYINAATGSDANAGTSAAAPLQSLTALSAITLQPGDSVLLARGTSYDGPLTIKNSGTVSSPITFGAYGDGASPVITGGDTGIYGSKTQNIVVQDLTVTNTTGNAIFAHGATNWVVDNVTVEDTGSALKSGAISFESSTNVLIRDSSISGVTGDGIWVDGAKGITIENTRISTVQGHDGDNIQVVNSSNVLILGNHLDMSGHTDSTKGNLVVNMSDGVVIENNVLVGGGYGASVNSNNVTIAANEIFGQGGYTWTFGIGVGEKWSVKNYNIYDNYIHDVRFGVALTGSGTTVVNRTNIDVHDNTFDNIAGAAIKVDRPSSGEFVDNQISTNTTAERVSSDVIAAGTFQFGQNTAFTSLAPHAIADVVLATSDAVKVTGNVLSNDVDPSGGTIAVTEFGGKTFDQSLHLAGQYGTVSINHDGSFVYTVNQAAMSTTVKPVTDVFNYLISDGEQQGYATLTVDLAARLKVAPVAVNDGATVNSSGTASGNVLTNDTDRNGDHLYVRTVDATKIGVTPVKVMGDYGVLSIASDGSFTYQVDPTKIAGDQPLHDNFMYKVSDTGLQDTGSLTVWIDPHTLGV